MATSRIEVKSPWVEKILYYKIRACDKVNDTYQVYFYLRTPCRLDGEEEDSYFKKTLRCDDFKYNSLQKFLEQMSERIIPCDTSKSEEENKETEIQRWLNV